MIRKKKKFLVFKIKFILNNLISFCYVFSNPVINEINMNFTIKFNIFKQFYYLVYN